MDLPTCGLCTHAIGETPHANVRMGNGTTVYAHEHCVRFFLYGQRKSGEHCPRCGKVWAALRALLTVADPQIDRFCWCPDISVRQARTENIPK